MERHLRSFGLVALVALSVLSCAPTRADRPAATGVAGPSEQAAPSAPTPTLIVVTRTEPRTLLPKTLNSGVIGDGPSARRLFNAGLFLVDEREVPSPYLVEELPKLGTDTWKVLPDGKMETTYKLRPNLTWHDGAPLTADDVAFAWKVFADPALAATFTATPQNLIEGSVVLDARTIVVKWSRPSPDADSMPLNRFQPLPRHLLEAAYEQGPAETFAVHPYWSREYVGAGPFKVDRWDSGVAIEASAFDGHALGRPKVDRMRLLWSSDPNTVVASLLAGAAHTTIDAAIRFQQGEILRNEWASSGAGRVLLSPIQTRYVQVQFRPDAVNPVALHDRRVRQALIHAMDRKELADALLGGQGVVAHMLYTEQRENFADIDRTITKYPFDPRRAEQIMAEAGFVKGRDGFFASSSGEPFTPEMRALGGAAEEQELTILTDLMRRSGMNIQPLVVPTARAMDGQYVATFPGMSTSQTSTGGDTPLVKLITSRIPGPNNRWSGTALGGWSNAEYDRGHEAFGTLLDRAARNEVLVGMLKLVSDELPIFPLYYNFQVDAHNAAVAGIAGAGDVTNVHEWHFTSAPR